MFDEMSGPMMWVGLIVGIIAIIAIVEVFLSTLFNRFGTSVYPHRIGTELPRIRKQQ
jgi:hypothetical protein